MLYLLFLQIVALFPSCWWSGKSPLDKHLVSLLRYLKNLISSLQDSLLSEPDGNRLNIRYV